MTSRAVLDQAVHKKVKIAVDARLAGTPGTGVASYRRAVLAALEVAGRTTLALRDESVGCFGAPSPRHEAAARWVSAWSSRPRRLHAVHHSAAASRAFGGSASRATLPPDRPTPEAGEPAALWRRDIFRLAQVHFGRRGTLLRLTPPQPVGIMHWTYPIPALVEGWINIHTVHDAIPLRRPDLSPVAADRLRACLIAIAAQTDRIVTVSGWAHRTILDALPIPPDLVSDCGGGLADTPDIDAWHPGGGADLRRGHRNVLPHDLQPGGYLFVCGTIEPRKNLARLAAAWRASGCGMPLVMAGPDGAGGPADTGADRLRHDLERVGVRVLPYQDRPVLIDLIRNARALLCVSLEEGFGLPVAEAMALGTPVLTSNRGALAETAGDACLTVDPDDVQAIAEGVRRIVADDDLCAVLAERGRVRAEAFGPRAFGRRLTPMYDRLIDRRIADGRWRDLGGRS